MTRRKRRPSSSQVSEGQTPRQGRGRGRGGVSDSARTLSEPFFPRTSPWRSALAACLPVLLILFSAISLATWKVHQHKVQVIQKKSEEFQETQQMRKEMKIAVKIRGINGDNRISQGFIERLGGMGCGGRTEWIGQREWTSGSEGQPQTTAHAFPPCPSRSHASPHPSSRGCGCFSGTCFSSYELVKNLLQKGP